MNDGKGQNEPWWLLNLCCKIQCDSQHSASFPMKSGLPAPHFFCGRPSFYYSHSMIMEARMMSFFNVGGGYFWKWELIHIAQTCFFHSCLSLLTFLRMHVGVKLLPREGPCNCSRAHPHTRSFPHPGLGSVTFDGMLNGKGAGCFWSAQKFSQYSVHHLFSFFFF